MSSIWDIKSAIENGIGWLEDALRDITEDGDALDGWPALSEAAGKIEAVLVEAKKLLPLHPELERAIEDEAEFVDTHDSPESLGLEPR
jgi:hypothetical protein